MMSFLITVLLFPIILVSVKLVLDDHISVSNSKEAIRAHKLHQSKKQRTNHSKLSILKEPISWVIETWQSTSQRIIEFLAITLTSFVFLLTLNIVMNGNLPIMIVEILFFLISTLLAITGRKFVKDAKLRSEVAAIDTELPSIIVMFSLLVNAGESLRSGIEYLTQFPQSKISEIFQAVINFHREGSTITQSLDRAAETSQSRSLRKFTDALALSIERGSSLNVVLANQTSESRAAYKAELLRISGKAELKLMIPIVFLILPISIIFALLPSLRALSIVM
jgi:tight adherence protein C